MGEERNIQREQVEDYLNDIDGLYDINYVKEDDGFWNFNAKGTDQIGTKIFYGIKVDINNPDNIKYKILNQCFYEL